MRNPFAVQVYERFLSGESIQQLSAELEIPADRIEKRLRAAAVYLQARPHLHLIASTPTRQPEHCGQPD
jgi:hypothetical protein